jgi:hypothetical protein
MGCADHTSEVAVYMTLIAYGAVVTLIGLALFGLHPLVGGIAVFVGVSLAALGHTEAEAQTRR